MPTRLETLLELTLRTSTANVDPFKDDLRYVAIISDRTSGCLSWKISLFACLYFLFLPFISGLNC